MALETAIAWTTATANFWMGCQKVSSGCAHCYAETLTTNRMGLTVWGPPGSSSRQAVKGVYANVRKLEREAAAGLLSGPAPGLPPLVFVGSLMDWAEDHPDAAAVRPRMWDLIRECKHLHFQMLTKRAHLIAGLLPDDWGPNGYPNVWLGTSIESADAIDNQTHRPVVERADHLRKIPAAVRFISYEPAVGPLADALDLSGIDWVIYGGESGPGYRAEGTSEDPKLWARDMFHACAEAGVAYFHKQSAAFRTEMGIELDGAVVRKYPAPRTPVGHGGTLF